MKFTSDPRKAAINLLKHGVRFEDAEFVLHDPHAISAEDNRHQEQRWLTIGTDQYGRILVVVYAYNAEELRLISARKASASERLKYHERFL